MSSQLDGKAFPSRWQWATNSHAENSIRWSKAKEWKKKPTQLYYKTNKQSYSSMLFKQWTERMTSTNCTSDEDTLRWNREHRMLWAEIECGLLFLFFSFAFVSTEWRIIYVTWNLIILLRLKRWHEQWNVHACTKIAHFIGRNRLSFGIHEYVILHEMSL